MKYKYRTFMPKTPYCLKCGAPQSLEVTKKWKAEDGYQYDIVEFRLCGIELFEVNFEDKIGLACQECVEKLEYENSHFAFGFAST